MVAMAIPDFQPAGIPCKRKPTLGLDIEVRGAIFPAVGALHFPPSE